VAPLYYRTISELHEGLKKKEFTSVELTQAVIKRIGEIEGKIHSFITVTPDMALEQAGDADRRISSGDHFPSLCGIPMAIKDIFCTKGVRTTCASRILSNFVPPYDSTITRRLREAGAVFVGKTNMDEFAMGSSTETSFYGTTFNPWDTSRVPGGSSGGSAAAVASGECIASVGTDTGGSIRQPASLCGIVGLKPTYGRVSRYGMIAFASSLDQGGPMTKDVKDCAIVLQAIAGHDPADSTSVNRPVPDYLKALEKGIGRMKFGIPKEYFMPGMDPEVEGAVRKAIGTLKAMGAELVEISLPHTEFAISTYYIIAPSEASSNLARYDGVKFGYRTPKYQDLMDMYLKTRSEGFGNEVKRRIMLGTYALSSGYYEAYYRKAQQVRTLLRLDFIKAFDKCDIIVTPTTPTPAFKIGEKTSDPLQMYLSDIFTISCNLAGLPGVSLPCGLTKEGLPIGLQILGRPFDEETVLSSAYSYEQSAQLIKRQPSI